MASYNWELFLWIWVNVALSLPISEYLTAEAKQWFLRNTKLPQADIYMSEEYNKLSQKLMDDQWLNISLVGITDLSLHERSVLSPW